jgi:hypothetical protein
MRRRAVRLTFIPFQSERRFDSEREEGERGVNRGQRRERERQDRGERERGGVPRVELSFFFASISS